MNRELVTLACIVMSFVSFAGNKGNWNLQEQKDIKVIERSLGEDLRSIPYLPSLSHDGNTIYIYSDVCFEDLQVTILDESREITYSDIINVFENQYYSFLFSPTKKGTYTIELTNSEHSFWGEFILY